MIGIIDYGMGNLRSIMKALEYLQLPAEFVSEPAELERMSGLILPGVGAFPQAMANLKAAGLVETIAGQIADGKPFLGICLGMQLLFAESTELGVTPGLGLLPGRVDVLTGQVKIPHMGWNRLNFTAEHPLWKGMPEETYVYFVHSFALKEQTPDVIATTTYGSEVPVAVARGNLMGVQFHPEKSGSEGLQILKNFGGMVAW